MEGEEKPKLRVIRGGKRPYNWAEESQAAIAAHEEETEIVYQGDFEGESKVTIFSKPTFTVSIVHDGTNRCQAGIERVQAGGAHVTVWNQPRGLRARYLGYRSTLRRWSRRIQGYRH